MERAPTKWSRDDRDLLVELRTEMMSVKASLIVMDGSIKAIDSGISNRVLNLEGNSVSKVEMTTLETNVNKRIDSLEAKATKLSNMLWLISVLSAGAGAVLLAVLNGLASNIHL